MSARPHRGTCPALVDRSLPCRSTTVCSSKRWTCSGGSSPQTRGAARGSIRPQGRRAPPCRTRHWSPRAWSRQPPQPALTDLKKPDRPDEAQFAMRALHSAPQSPAADQPRSAPGAASPAGVVLAGPLPARDRACRAGGDPVSPAGRSRPARPCPARDRACATPDRTSSPRRPGPAGRPAQGPRSGSDAQRRAAGTGPRSRAGRSR
jgi:hypothetical protein